MRTSRPLAAAAVAQAAPDSATFGVVFDSHAVNPSVARNLFVKGEIERWAKVVRDNGIRAGD